MRPNDLVVIEVATEKAKWLCQIKNVSKSKWIILAEIVSISGQLYVHFVLSNDQTIIEFHSW